MATGGGDAGGTSNGKKRKASAMATGVVVEALLKREPRRGMGVAELERIRAGLEMAQICGGYAIVPSLSTASAAALHHFPVLPLPAPQPPPPPCFVDHVTGMAMAHHQYVGNGALKLEYFTPYNYRAQNYTNDSLSRFLTSNGPASRHQKNQVDQIQSAVTTANPVSGQAASSESPSPAYQLQDRRRAQPLQLDNTRKVAFVNLVDSDDDDGGAVEELDLELRL